MPMSGGTRNKKRKGYEDDSAIKNTLRELGIFLIYLIAATIIIFGSENFYKFHFNDMIQRTFTKRLIISENELEFFYNEILTVADFWTFMDTTFLDGIYGIETNHNSNNNDSKYVAILLGTPRLRQYRVRNNTCNIHNAFKKHFRTCYGRFNSVNQEIETEYKGSKFFKLNSYQIWGKLEFYPTQCYIENLKLTRYENEEIFKKLKNILWIDQGTRLIILEFNLYNANIDMFCLIKFYIEISPTGGVIPWHKIHIIKFLNNLNTIFNYILIISLIIFYSMTFYYLKIEIIEMVKMKLKYLLSIWNALDLIILIFGILSLIFNIWKFAYLKNYIEKINIKNTIDFINFDIIDFWEFHYNNIMGICIFLIWIKIFKYISFNKTMIQFSYTLKSCAKDIFGFGIMFLIIFLAFVQLGLLLFGTKLEEFHNFSTTCVTMVRMILGDFNYPALEETNRFLGPIFFLSYIFLVFFILLNMFLAIINDSYSAIKSDITKSDIDLMKFL
ncbi:polycystic kidney disease 2-like 2 protein, partial [Condylostylus longicornis]|uniref:polycystic kidney disease 2-like 2 protein n=1 Tax=Condylostylus longicornis TaxID=2530218 RepID=UPI00244DB460